MIDRIAPTRRPIGKNDGTQIWESLLFCHWEVSAAALRDLVPPELKIDTFDGKAYIATVPFRMRAIRPRWLPSALAFNFFETNVRTYVVHNNRPGVYFFSLDASSRLAVWAARTGWALPYYFATMAGSQRDGSYVYESRRDSGVQHFVEFQKSNRIGVSPPGTLEHFLFERYLLFVKRRQKILVGQVHHSPYEVFDAKIKRMEGGLIRAAGIDLSDELPDLAHFSPGVSVEVFGIRDAIC